MKSSYHYFSLDLLEIVFAVLIPNHDVIMWVRYELNVHFERRICGTDFELDLEKSEILIAEDQCWKFWV